MTAVDTAQWQYFRIGDIFSVTKGVRLTRANMAPGETPFIGATAFNNGVTAMVGNTGSIQRADTITVAYNGSVGQAFFHDYEYWASDDVNVLAPRNSELTRMAGLFLCAIFRGMGARFSFTEKWTAEKMSNDRIKLPVNADGAPDWAGMATVMEGIVDASKQRLAALSTVPYRPRTVSEADWGTFTVNELLTITAGRGCSKKEISDHPGDLPVVQSSGTNNSVTGSISEAYCVSKGYVVTEGAALTLVGTGQGAVGFVAFHSEPVVVGNNAKLLRPIEELTDNQLLFLGAALNALRSRFSYSDIASIGRYLRMEIKLPADSEGRPDWARMEALIDRVLNRVRGRVDQLATLAVLDPSTKSEEC